MRLLIDGDIIAYKAATTAEVPVNWGDGHWSLFAHEADVIARMNEDMEKLVEGSGAQYVVTALSHSNNFRKTVYPEYKANRNNTRRPMLLQFAKDYLWEQWNGLVYKNIEADDVLGILGSNNPDTVIWSIDKDLKTIPGNHYTDGDIIEINETEADYWFFYQTLVGDSTDNYPGCPKVGPKTAEKILAKECTWEAVVEAFDKAGLGEQEALKNARLARILRKGEYNPDTGEVLLWTPETQ